MIKDGESTGRNFYYPETFAYAQWRVHIKLKDETINPPLSAIQQPGVKHAYGVQFISSLDYTARTTSCCG